MRGTPSDEYGEIPMRRATVRQKNEDGRGRTICRGWTSDRLLLYYRLCKRIVLRAYGRLLERFCADIGPRGPGDGCARDGDIDSAQRMGGLEGIRRKRIREGCGTETGVQPMLSV